VFSPLLLYRVCYNSSYPELLLFHIDSSLRSNRLRLIPYDILTPNSVSFTVELSQLILLLDYSSHDYSALLIVTHYA